MINRKSISVWLIMQDGKNKGKMALQRRSHKNKSFHFIYQATWAGKAEQNEKVEDAIIRECREELGDVFADNFDFSKLEIVSRGNFTMKGADWESFNYLGRINEASLSAVIMHDEAFPGFIFVSDKDKIYSVKSGKEPKSNIVLFDDQYKVLEGILNGIKGNNK